MARQQWLNHFASMQETVAQTRLGQSSGMGQGYGHDIVIDDAGLASLRSDDLWSLFSKVEKEDEEGSHPSVYVERVPFEANHTDFSFNHEWLRKKCSALTILQNSGLDACQLEDQLLALLASNMQSMFPWIFYSKKRTEF